MGSESEFVLGPATPRARVIRETMPDSAALYVRNVDGSLSRIGAEQGATQAFVGGGLGGSGGESEFVVGQADPPSRALGGNPALVDYSFTSIKNGGFATSDASVIPPTRARHPFRKMQEAEIKLDAGDTLWEGRVDTIGEDSSQGGVEVALIGHSVELAETEFIFLGVSNDLSLWGDPPVERIESAANSTISVNQAFQISAGEKGVQINMDADRNVETTARGEAWWGAYADILVAEIQYIASQTLSPNMDPEVRVFSAPDAAVGSSANLTTTLAVITFTPTPQPYASFRDTPTTQVNKAARTLTLHAISVYGDHELSRYGIDGLPDGLLFSDVLEHLVGQRAAGLSTSAYGQPTVARSSQPSPNLAWLESTSIRDILDEGLTLEPEYTWGVWENRAFHYGPGQGSRWVVRRSDGAEFADEGDTAEFDFNVVVVNFTDKDGTARRVGPVGWGVDSEDASLRDDSPDNPVNAAGVGDKPLVIDIGTASGDKAVALGQLALSEATRPRFAGAVSLPRYAERDGAWCPTSLLRANDTIFDAEHGVELPVAEASYARSDVLPCRATIDTPANRLDAAIAGLEARPRKVRAKRIRRRRRRIRGRVRRKRRRAQREERRG